MEAIFLKKDAFNKTRHKTDNLQHCAVGRRLGDVIIKKIHTRVAT